MLSGHRGSLQVVVHLESGFVHLHAPVTRASFFRRRCARRSAYLKPITAFYHVWVAGEMLAVTRFALFSLLEKLTDGAFRLFFCSRKDSPLVLSVQA
ncbi:hypothetical protein SAMN05446635_7209 [Burkholderia sp. OK233]|nr:hypothetical protein SAMN05446635_7209 [Burkholderia sp. OK233]